MGELDEGARTRIRAEVGVKLSQRLWIYRRALVPEQGVAPFALIGMLSEVRPARCKQRGGRNFPTQIGPT